MNFCRLIGFPLGLTCFSAVLFVRHSKIPVPMSALGQKQTS
jgi:hypothetical protein